MPGGIQSNGLIRFVHCVDYSEIAHSQRVIALELTPEGLAEVWGFLQELNNLKNTLIGRFV